MRLHLVHLFILVMATATSAKAQVLYGSIVGNVTDTSSAAIPGAQIEIVNAGTGQQWDVPAGSEGTCASATLSPGVYTVTISAAGFKPVTRRDVNVAAIASVRANAELELDQMSSSQPGVITGVQNTGPEDLDERQFRFGVRLSF